MPLLGAHMSIAGGYYKAVEAAAELKMDCVQIFTKNNNQWRAKPLTQQDVAQFGQALTETGIVMPCAHSSYLINLASPKDDLWDKSLDAFVIELERAERLGLAGVVIHPGSFVDSSEEAGLRRIVEALDRTLDATQQMQTQIWLECTAGQGTNLGHRFEHLGFMINEVEENSRLGVCIDTCHVFAAGYPLRTPRQYAATLEEFDEVVGIEWIRAFHLNDSKRELGSRVDRHENIGEGKLGREPFRHLLNDSRFAEHPMYMETPKGLREGRQLDAVNLSRLRRMVRKSRP